MSATSAGTTDGDRPQQAQSDRGEQATAAERARDTHAERDVGEEVERRAAAEAERRDRGELVADMCERRLHREREEDDAGHHRQMQVGVDIARKGGALGAASVGEQLLAADREEVEVRQPERGRDHEPEHRGDDHAGADSAGSLAEADGDQGLADRDDHDQPVTLDEVRRLHAPAAASHRRSGPKKADGERGQPEDRLEPAVDEPRDDDERGAERGPRERFAGSPRAGPGRRVLRARTASGA